MGTKFVVAVRDRAVDGYMQPFFVPSIGMAVRSFQDEVNNPDSPMYKHPEDYDLYQLATFDDESGAFDGMPRPTMIAVGKDSVRGVK